MSVPIKIVNAPSVVSGLLLTMVCCNLFSVASPEISISTSVAFGAGKFSFVDVCMLIPRVL